jgi:hypothetical protein
MTTLAGPESNHKITMTLIPAYGRDYRTPPAVKADWEAGKDFVIADIGSRETGRYINKADAEKYAPSETIWVRFNSLTDIIRVDKNP